YESAGQNWERAAMIKARPIAGDIVAGEAFLEMLHPFVWRKSLDFFAIQDIHSIKRQINARRGGSTMEVAGHDIKLGRGGIREIEFFAQTQQLIWGGRDSSLRVRDTCEALRALARAGHLESIVSSRLIQAYRFHRRIENRLQMIDDQQTHSLPEDEAELERIAFLMGYEGRAEFETALLEELRAVESHYAVLFEKTPDLSGPGNLVFTGADDDPETLETLARMGFREPARVAERIRVWHHGRYSSTRSARARELLTELIPTVLETLSTTNDPDAALLRFDDFLRTLPAGVHILSLFANNPALLALLARIMGSAPRLANLLSRHPIMLEGVLQPGSLDPGAGGEGLDADLERALAEAYHYEEVLDACRYWNNVRVFEIGVQMLNGRIDGAEAGRPLADIATACVRALLPATAREFARRHGAVPDSAFAVLGFGKLGGRELTTESDLDLLFLYETGDEHAESDGSRPLPCQTYYARLCQRFIGAMSAPTNEGSLYEVDMRLRPAGASGPIATSLAAFTRYQNEDAWTWEHLALTRARVIAAPEAFAARIEQTIASALTRKRDPDRLVSAVADMRERMERELAVDDFWSIKRFRGGMIDIEFIAQYLQLRHAHLHPEVLSTDTTEALERLAEAGCLDPSVAGELIEAMTLWRRLQGIVRLAFGAGVAGRHESPALQAFVARATGAADYAALEERSLALAARSYRHFEEIVARPAAEAEATTGKDRR
ncbi:MAG: bifunctional [glutamine synthetase] adenylyltransferase/[glutamine synthetase]-adenylyl-L-tyrosine phosphorylase, partial [Defluviicoccus sp.]|nr:bifunctional [glutamine synthetase] adenylyltransferase/[glutamine synthetase]-adenylyl-L-tyrosine phosphorylase [Defluviicoccus sp.]